jgi:hypothetical protein
MSQYSSQDHLSLLDGKLIIVPIQTPDFKTTNVKYWYQEYKAYVRLVWQSHQVFTPIVICTYNLTTLSQYVNSFVVSFTTMLLVLFNWLLSFILLYILLFLSYVLFCKHFWDPKHVHCHLVYLLLVSIVVKHNSVLLNLITGCLYWLTTCFVQLHDHHQVYKS